jgi:hypothetical protein
MMTTGMRTGIETIKTLETLETLLRLDDKSEQKMRDAGGDDEKER